MEVYSVEHPVPEAQRKALAEHRVLAMYNASKPRGEPPTLQDKNVALKYIAKGTTSLPTITIATRDRIEAEMKARKLADIHRIATEAAAAKEVSPKQFGDIVNAALSL